MQYDNQMQAGRGSIVRALGPRRRVGLGGLAAAPSMPALNGNLAGPPGGIDGDPGGWPPSKDFLGNNPSYVDPGNWNRPPMPFPRDGGLARALAKRPRLGGPVY